jgi:hypothetical protein
MHKEYDEQKGPPHPDKIPYEQRKWRRLSDCVAKQQERRHEKSGNDERPAESQ